MKARIVELDNIFIIYLNPETLEESSELIRLKINSRKKNNAVIYSFAQKKGTIHSSFFIKKLKKERSLN